MRHLGLSRWGSVALLVVVIAGSIGCDAGRPYATLSFDRNHHSVAASADNELVAVGLWDDTVALFETRTGRQRHRLGPANMCLHFESGWSGAWAVCFSPDARRVAAGSWASLAFLEELGLAPRDAIRVWSTETGERLLSIRDEYTVEEIAWSPDGKYLASGHRDGGVKLWDAETGELALEYEGVIDTVKWHPRRVTALCFSPDSRWVAWGTDLGRVRLGGVDGRREIELTSWSERVPGLTFSPTGEALAAIANSGIVVWLDATGQREFSRPDYGLPEGLMRSFPDFDLLPQLPILVIEPGAQQLVGWGFGPPKMMIEGDLFLSDPADDELGYEPSESVDMVSVVWDYHASGDYTVRHHERTHTGGRKLAAFGGGSTGCLVVWEVEARAVEIRPPSEDVDVPSGQEPDRGEYIVIGQVRAYDALTGQPLSRD